MKSLFRLLLIAVFGSLAFVSFAAGKKIVLVAGKPSHPPGMHEFRAGSLLLQQCTAKPLCENLV